MAGADTGALITLAAAGVKRIITLEVPGAVEIPFAIRFHQENAAKKNRADAYVALGCVVRGDTPHFEYVCHTVTQGILELNLRLPVPVIFGVLTVNSEEQARERIGGAHGHKGFEAGQTAVRMINFTKQAGR